MSIVHVTKFSLKFYKRGVITASLCGIEIRTEDMELLAVSVAQWAKKPSQFTCTRIVQEVMPVVRFP